MKPTWRQGSGKLPEFGAIFMSNPKTREECFARSIFALPFSSLNFVREVKAGMLLFLFDHQQKKLFGVFEAVSDGGLNIVPDACTSSRNYFPAQVRFRIIWKCSPLCQHEFRDAIRDNYYNEYKFNFGLSKDQVRKLLHLFESKVKIQESPTEKKIKHSDQSSEKKAPSESMISHGHFDHSDASVNQKSSVEQLELGDFIPLFSPESSPSSSSQSSPCHSKDEDLSVSEHKPKVKGLYSDHVGERKSVFGRLEATAKSTTDEAKDSDIEESRSHANVITTKEIMENLLQRQRSWMKKIETGSNHALRKRESPKVASVFSRLNIISKSRKHGMDASEEKENKRGHGGCDMYHGRGEKDRLTIPVARLGNGGENVDYTKLFCRDMEGRLWMIPKV